MVNCDICVARCVGVVLLQKKKDAGFAISVSGLRPRLLRTRQLGQRIIKLHVYAPWDSLCATVVFVWKSEGNGGVTSISQTQSCCHEPRTRCRARIASSFEASTHSRTAIPGLSGLSRRRSFNEGRAGQGAAGWLVGRRCAVGAGGKDRDRGSESR